MGRRYTARHSAERADKQLARLGWRGTVYDNAALRRARRWRAAGYTLLIVGAALLLGAAATLVALRRLYPHL